MVVQYPHRIYIYFSAGAVQNESGDWVTNAVPSPINRLCRFEPAKANAFITGVDGKQISLRGIVYMPVDTRIEVGTRVEVFQEGFLIVNETVKQFSEGQLNQRLWL